MNKGLKFILYIILILTIIAIVWLMFGISNPNTKAPSDTKTEILTGEEITNEPSIVNYENTDTFEEDVMKDLEGFFGNNNGYEDVQGEYGFTNPENE